MVAKVNRTAFRRLRQCRRSNDVNGEQLQDLQQALRDGHLGEATIVPLVDPDEHDDHHDQRCLKQRLDRPANPRTGPQQLLEAAGEMGQRQCQYDGSEPK